MKGLEIFRVLVQLIDDSNNAEDAIRMFELLKGVRRLGVFELKVLNNMGGIDRIATLLPSRPFDLVGNDGDIIRKDQDEDSIRKL